MKLEKSKPWHQFEFYFGVGFMVYGLVQENWLDLLAAYLFFVMSVVSTNRQNIDKLYEHIEEGEGNENQ